MAPVGVGEGEGTLGGRGNEEVKREECLEGSVKGVSVTGWEKTRK